MSRVAAEAASGCCWGCPAAPISSDSGTSEADATSSPQSCGKASGVVVLMECGLKLSVVQRRHDVCGAVAVTVARRCTQPIVIIGCYNLPLRSFAT